MGKETWLHYDNYDLWNASYTLEGNSDGGEHIRTNNTI